MKNVLFVCIENSNRSQMAEAFGKMFGQDIINAFSAGSRPSGIVNPKAIKAMAELGYNLAEHGSVSVDEFRDREFEYVISMGCGDDCPFIPAKYREDWLIPDPKYLNEQEFNVVRDYIGLKVKELISKISLNEV